MTNVKDRVRKWLDAIYSYRAVPANDISELDDTVSDMEDYLEAADGIDLVLTVKYSSLYDPDRPDQLIVNDPRFPGSRRK